MADVNVHRKSDASETEKQSRASRLSARTRAKVCVCLPASGTNFTNYLTQERLSNGSAKDGGAVSEE